MRARITMPKEPWDVTIQVRPGFVVRPLEPRLTTEVLNPAELLDGERAEWPGVFVWLWRAIFGAPRRDSAETRGLRAWVIAVTRDEDHRRVAMMTHGELTVFIAQYTKAQTVWVELVGAECQSQIVPQSPTPAPTGSAPGVARAGGPRRLRTPDGQEIEIPPGVNIQPFSEQAFIAKFGPGAPKDGG